MKTICKWFLPLCVIIILVGCSDSDSQQGSAETSSETVSIMPRSDNPSCLVEWEDPVMVKCFEGSLEWVETMCAPPRRGSGEKMTFSEDTGCPKDRGYFGRCIIDGEESFEYLTPIFNSSPDEGAKYKEMMKENCIGNNDYAQWEEL